MNWLRGLSISILILLFCFYSENCLAQTRDQMFVGARPMAMGETFVGIADDGNALYWNPAGLPFINHYEVNSMYADLYRTGVKNNYVAFTVPYSNKLALGVDWFNIGFNDEELGYNQNQLNFALAYKVFNRLSVGANVKYLNTFTKLDGNTEGEGSGWAADFGLISHITNKIRLGVMVHDIIEPEITYNHGTDDKIRSRNVRFGGSYRPFNNLIVAADIDDRIHFGSEYLLLNMLSLRGGLQKDLYTSEGMIYSFGFGLKWQFINFDYSYTIPSTLENTSRFSIGFFFDLFPSKVRIEKAKLKQIFPSQYKHYTNNPLGHISLVNVGEEPIHAKLGVFIPNLMEKPTEKSIIVRPKIQDDFPINVVLKDNILEINDDMASSITVEVSYKTKRKTYSDKYNASVVVYNKNAINWTASGVESAASFITTTSDGIDRFNRETIINLKRNESEFIGENISKAMQIFNALSAYDIQYIADPNNPYGVVSTTEQAVDNIQFPEETLSKKRGDCDDLTVLYAALLENAGIQTAFLSVPEHLFLLINSGIPENQQLVLGLNSDQYVIYHNMVWIPVEVTMVGKSFSDAWMFGINRYNQYESLNQIEIIPVHQAWQRYPAVQVKSATYEHYVLDKSILSNLITQDFQQMEFERNHFVESRQPSTNLPDSVYCKYANELGIHYALSGYTQDSHRTFSKAVHKIKNASILNNLGNTYLIQNEPDSAALCYEKSQQIDPSDGGIWMNMGIIFLSQGDTTLADAVFSKARDSYGSLSDLFSQLGIASDETGAQKGRIGDPNREELMQRFKKTEEQAGRQKQAALDELLKKHKDSKLKQQMKPKITMGQIEKYLYWKQ